MLKTKRSRIFFIILWTVTAVNLFFAVRGYIKNEKSKEYNQQLRERIRIEEIEVERIRKGMEGGVK